MIYFRISPDILSKDVQNAFDQELLRVAAEKTIDAVNPSREVSLTIALDNDETLRELNRQFRDIDATTDVLSFSSNEIDPDSGELYLGDVVISYPRAVQQAEDVGHSVNAELQLLVVHGVLHLFGYDHINEDDKKVMWSIQDAVLAQLGIPHGSLGLGD